VGGRNDYSLADNVSQAVRLNGNQASQRKKEVSKTAPADDLSQDPNWREFQRLIADPNWYASHFGKCVVIRDGQFVGFYASKEAYMESLRGTLIRHGASPALLMMVGEENDVIDIPTPLEIIEDDK
jgi:hypothetical protein